MRRHLAQTVRTLVRLLVLVELRLLLLLVRLLLLVMLLLVRLLLIVLVTVALMVIQIHAFDTGYPLWPWCAGAALPRSPHPGEIACDAPPLSS